MKWNKKMEKAYSEYIDDLSNPIKNDEDKVYELIDRSKKSDKEPKDKTEITKYGPVYDFTTRSDADTTRINNELKRSGKFSRDEIRDATLQYSPDSHGHVDEYIKGVLASKPLGRDPAVPKRPEPFTGSKYTKGRMKGMEDELMQRAMGKNDEEIDKGAIDPYDIHTDDSNDEELWEAKYNKYYGKDENAMVKPEVTEAEEEAEFNNRPKKKMGWNKEDGIDSMGKAWNAFKKWNDEEHKWMDRESKDMADEDSGLVKRTIANTKPMKEVPGKIYNAEDPKDAEEFINRVRKKKGIKKNEKEDMQIGKMNEREG